MGVLQNLDKALDLSVKLPEFDEQDLAGTVLPVKEEITKLPQRHSDVLDVFKSITNKKDLEAYERYLADQAEREKFTLAIAAMAFTIC